MKFTTIRIEGSILSPDILDKIQMGELGGQRPEDFWLDSSTKVKDEIARAWADAHDLWRIFCHQRERLGDKGTGTSETRKYWIIPLLGMFGYDAEPARAEVINSKSYAISHRTAKLDAFPIHVMGFNDSLDKKREDSGPRMSPHALVQEYINITEHLYAIVSNGIHLRLLRDSSRLVKLSFIEFDLQSMMEEEHFADFAIMYRLIHASRMPARQDAGADSLIEKYHQDALDSGSRIREGLSEAVENSIKSLTEGFLNHPDNNELREAVESGRISHFTFYQYHLRLIYRILFLIVIEERNLIYPAGADLRKVRIYYDYYSISRLRQLCEKRHLSHKGYNDLWIALKNTFRIFEKEYFGQQLGIKPLGGDLFSPNAIGILNVCNLDNSVLLECLRNLSFFTNKNNNQKMRVNYASLNVEEFGSVYEGLLEYDPLVEKQNNFWRFIFIAGEGRASSGSHYTPDELVQPLIKHSLEYIIEDKLKEPNKEKALLSIKVCDVASGSGHILLNAARRIATDLAKVRTGEDQPSPTAFREAVRDVIRHCIYGVDKNRLAVELCKIALWLEAHNPGQPLNFLDHHIKCGDSIVGLAHMGELQKGIAEEAFKRLPDDDKDVCATLRKVNKTERDKQMSFDFEGAVGGKIKDIAVLFNKFSELPEWTPEEIEEKTKAYLSLTSGEGWHNLKAFADIQVAQFFIPKTKENQSKIITDGTYRRYLAEGKRPVGIAVAKADAIAGEKKFFHWFLEFPEVFAEGGFDCILGNPPFLGDKKLRKVFGEAFLEYIQYNYSPATICDLVTYFFRRNYNLINKKGFISLIATNTISQGANRVGGLEYILKSGGFINYAFPSMRWPGRAAVVVSLISICRRAVYNCFLRNTKVSFISSLLTEESGETPTYPLLENSRKAFIGNYVLGEGFTLQPEQAHNLYAKNNRNRDIVYPYLNGYDLNSSPTQTASRYVINFFGMPLRREREDLWRSYSEKKIKQLESEGIVAPDFKGPVATDYPDCINIIQDKVYPSRIQSKEKNVRIRWWQHARYRPELLEATQNMKQVLVIAQVSKTVAFSMVPNNQVLDTQLSVVAFDDYKTFAVLQSNVHYHWAWKYCTTMKNDLRYVVQSVFEPFPFPQSSSLGTQHCLDQIGEEYHEHRRQLMFYLQIGLTKAYNIFHKKDLSIDDIEKASKQPTTICEKGYQDILKLRELHLEMDNAVLSAYGWTDLNLAHDFYEVDYLPENDRIRFTISPEARREVLKRLLKLNHEIREQEEKEGLWDKKKTKLTKIIKPETSQQSLLPEIDVSVLTATSYPPTETDRAICAAALSIVEQANGLPSMDHLDALLLTTHPEWCKAFLPKNEINDLNTAMGGTPTVLFVSQNQSIRWQDCRNYLENRRAIVINRGMTGQTIMVESGAKTVKNKLPKGVDKIVVYALNALNRINELRKDVNSQTQEQQNFIRILTQLHQKEVA